MTHKVYQSDSPLMSQMSKDYPTTPMPPISVRHSSYRGNPTIEILRGGQSWGEDHFGPEHFSFGLTKARMIRAALPVVQIFAESRGGQPWPGQAQTFTDLTGAGVLSVVVEKHDSFRSAAGSIVEQPYLKLISGETSIGLGVSKCQAIAFIAEELERFLHQNDRGPLVPVNKSDDD